MKHNRSLGNTNKQSHTTDAHSHIFNNSSIINANGSNNSALNDTFNRPINQSSRLREEVKNRDRMAQNSKYKENPLCHQIRRSETKELDYLRVKNRQLEQKNNRLAACLVTVETEKRQLFEMNKKYVSVVNQYYENEEKKAKENKCKKAQKIKDSAEQARVLQQLQRDHRNLSKHCLIMQEQIKNYSKQVQRYYELLDQLHTTNHGSVKELIEEIFELADDNKNLKKENNALNYELQKYKRSLDALKVTQQNKEKIIQSSDAEIGKIKSMINTVQQQSQDKSNKYQSKIYSLELKVERLEKELRQHQEGNMKKITNKNYSSSKISFAQPEICDLLKTANQRSRSSSLMAKSTKNITLKDKSNLRRVLNQQRKSLMIK